MFHYDTERWACQAPYETCGPWSVRGVAATAITPTDRTQRTKAWSVLWSARTDTRTIMISLDFSALHFYFF
jgi:hypothetical protein